MFASIKSITLKFGFQLDNIFVDGVQLGYSFCIISLVCIFLNGSLSHNPINLQVLNLRSTCIVSIHLIVNFVELAIDRIQVVVNNLHKVSNVALLGICSIPVAVDLVLGRSIIGCSQISNLDHCLICQIRIVLRTANRIFVIGIIQFTVGIGQSTFGPRVGCQIVICSLVGLTSCSLCSCCDACQSSVNIRLVFVIIKAV